MLGRLASVLVLSLLGGCPDFPERLLVPPGDGDAPAPTDGRAETTGPDSNALDDSAAEDVAPDDSTQDVAPGDSAPADIDPDQAPSPWILFDLTGWTYHTSTTNVAGHPQVTGGPETTLIPDECYQAGAAVVSTLDVSPPFAVEFEFSIYDDDGGPVYNSADGVAFMFAKDRGAYGTPPSGSSRGVITDGSGYAVHFAIWGTREVILADGQGTALQTSGGAAVASIYTHGQWKPVRVEVRSTSVKVYYDGALVIERAISVDPTHRAFGFGAGTGAADGEHRIRNVRLVTL